MQTKNESDADKNRSGVQGGDADRAGHFVGQYFGFVLGRGFEPRPGAMSQFFEIFPKKHHARAATPPCQDFTQPNCARRESLVATVATSQ